MLHVSIRVYGGIYLNVKICAHVHDFFHAVVKIYSMCTFSAPKTVQIDMRCFKLVVKRREGQQRFLSYLTNRLSFLFFTYHSYHVTTVLLLVFTIYWITAKHATVFALLHTWKIMEPRISQEACTSPAMKNKCVVSSSCWKNDGLHRRILGNGMNVHTNMHTKSEVAVGPG